MIEIDNILDAGQYLDGIDAVVFDLDDTLYPEKEYVQSGYHAVAALFPEIEDMVSKLWAVFDRGGKAVDEVLAVEGLDSDENREKALKAYRFQEPDIRLYSGVSEMLKQIRENRQIGIITDGRPEGQWAKIKSLKLHEYVDEVIVTDELGGTGYRKPNPIAFEIMQKKLGVDFNRMVYVGDNIRKDFAAPEKLGMRSIWFRNEEGIYAGRRGR